MVEFTLGLLTRVLTARSHSWNKCLQSCTLIHYLLCSRLDISLLEVLAWGCSSTVWSEVFITGTHCIKIVYGCIHSINSLIDIIQMFCDGIGVAASKYSRNLWQVQAHCSVCIYLIFYGGVYAYVFSRVEFFVCHVRIPQIVSWCLFFEQPSIIKGVLVY